MVRANKEDIVTDIKERLDFIYDSLVELDMPEDILDELNVVVEDVSMLDRMMKGER